MEKHEVIRSWSSILSKSELEAAKESWRRAEFRILQFVSENDDSAEPGFESETTQI